jgi:hypothetical protein
MVGFSHLGAALSIARIVQRLARFEANITAIDLLGHAFDVTGIRECG